MAPAAGRAATRTPARVLRARCGIYWPRARDIAGMDGPQQAARSGGGAVTVTVLLKVAKMMLDVLKLLYQAVQLVYGGEMAAARDESGAEMGWGVVGVEGGGRGGHAGQGACSETVKSTAVALCN